MASGEWIEGVMSSCSVAGVGRKTHAVRTRAMRPVVSTAATATSTTEWIQRNADGLSRLASARQPLLPSPLDIIRLHDMSLPTHHHTHIAARDAGCVGAVWLESGIAPGLVVVDSNRPAMNLATARGLLKQFGAAH